MQLPTAALKSAAFAAAIAFSAWTPAAQAVVIVGNLAGAANNSSSTGITGTSNPGVKATGFTMNAGTDFLLTSATLRLTVFAGSDPLVQIYSNSGSNTPATALLTLTDPGFSVGSLNQDYTFTANSAFTLSAGTSYWLVVSNTGASTFTWAANLPSIVPTGSEAASLGYRFGSSIAALNPSTTRNTFELNGTAVAAVPEPASMLLLAGGLLVLAGIKRARAQPGA